MAVFMLNICKFNGCGLSFQKLGDLIQHIEETHIDYDPRIIEQKELQQPSCLPLSYVLRFYTEAARKDAVPSVPHKKVTISPPRPTLVNTTPLVSRTPSGSDAEDDDAGSETDDSNDSWTTPEEFSSEFILRFGSRNATANPGDDKPFACPVPGCKKKYKNVNGIKYHSKNGHKKDGKIRKEFRCPCGKSYKSASGLKSHSAMAHKSTGSEGLKTLPIRTVTSLAVMDPAFTLVTKSSKGNLVQLGILTPTVTSQQASSINTPITLSPVAQKSSVPGL